MLPNQVTYHDNGTKKSLEFVNASQFYSEVILNFPMHSIISMTDEVKKE